MKTIFFVILILSFFPGVSQLNHCNCKADFDSLTTSIEKNYIGFDNSAFFSLKSDYTTFKNSMNDSVIKSVDFYDCYKLLKSYLRYFKDPHLTISLRTDTALRKLYSGIFSKIRHAKEFINQEPDDEICGLYKSGTSNYTVVVSKDSDTYVGKIIKGDSLFWFSEQVKFLLIPESDFFSGKTKYFLKDHLMTTVDYFFESKKITIMGVDVLYKIKNKEDELPDLAKFELNTSFKIISDSTNYLSIPNLDLGQKNIIDSILTLHHAELNSRPNLIIDLRNNGGGYSASFKNLLPLIYDKPFVLPPFYFKASLDNITMRIKSQSRNYDSIKLQQHKEYLLSNLDNVIEMHGYDTTVISNVPKYPERICVLVNRGTASAAEHFIYYCKLSKKVKVLGVNTRGAFNYLDLIAQRKLPSNYYQYLCPTGEYKNIPQMTNIGFQPDVTLKISEYGQWVESARKLLENDRNPR
jgi:Peptidase family S41